MSHLPFVPPACPSSNTYQMTRTIRTSVYHSGAGHQFPTRGISTGTPQALCRSVCTFINYRQNGAYCAKYTQVSWRQSLLSTVVKTFVEYAPKCATFVECVSECATLVAHLPRTFDTRRQLSTVVMFACGPSTFGHELSTSIRSTKIVIKSEKIPIPTIH